MLATDGKECKKLDQMIKDGAFASPKLDGYRCFAVIADKQVTLYTRNGEIYKNFPSIEESLLNMCGDGNYVLDGEIMSDNFNSMQKSAFASTRGTTVGDVKYYIFDYIPYEEYVNATFKIKSEDRLRMLNGFSSIKLLAGSVAPNIVFVQHTKVNSQKDILDLEIKYASEGYEGAMLRPNIPYYMGKKSNRMLKFKTMLSMDCVVEGMYEGENRNTGRLGGLSVRQENGESCDVGSGFTDGDRESIFNNPSSVLGRTCEIKYQELTPDGKMRFPIFIRWRDMGGKKI
jgi:DNA ligase-1